MKKVASAMLCLVVLTLSMGCSLDEHKANSELTVQKYFAAIKDNSIENAVACFSPLAFETTEKDKLKKMIESALSKTGEFTSCELIGWNVNVNFGSTSNCTLRYKTIYSNYEAEETFVLINDGPEGEMQIVSWNISSPAFFDIET